METESCIYCRRTLDVGELLEKAGKYRCKDENGCLEYQNREEPVDEAAMAEYLSDLVQSSLMDARRRIAAYKDAKEDPATGIKGEDARASEASIAEFAWMRSALDVLAAQYRENHPFAFGYDETKGNEYKILWNDADNDFSFAVWVSHSPGSGYALRVAKNSGVADPDPLYAAFIYKSYPDGEKEDVVKDLAVLLMALKEDRGLLADLLGRFRTEIEARSYRRDA